MYGLFGKEISPVLQIKIKAYSSTTQQTPSFFPLQQDEEREQLDRASDHG
jgi:hypothetical protein